jgi:hypothetical protein
MSSELITIGCKLPHGMKIEVGIEHIPGVWGSVSKGPNYACAVLNGWYSEHQKNHPNIQPIAMLDPEPGRTQIPKDLWLVWCDGMGKHHPARNNGLLFVVPDDKAGAKSALRDVEGRKTGFEPVDPNKLPEQIEEAPVLGREPIGNKPVRQD